MQLALKSLTALIVDVVRGTVRKRCNQKIRKADLQVCFWLPHRASAMWENPVALRGGQACAEQPQDREMDTQASC